MTDLLIYLGRHKLLIRPRATLLNTKFNKKSASRKKRSGGRILKAGQLYLQAYPYSSQDTIDKVSFEIGSF